MCPHLFSISIEYPRTDSTRVSVLLVSLFCFTELWGTGRGEVSVSFTQVSSAMEVQSPEGVRAEKVMKGALVSKLGSSIFFLIICNIFTCIAPWLYFLNLSIERFRLASWFIFFSEKSISIHKILRFHSLPKPSPPTWNSRTMH